MFSSGNKGVLCSSDYTNSERSQQEIDAIPLSTWITGGWIGIHHGGQVSIMFAAMEYLWSLHIKHLRANP